ncbi:MAG TPA: PHP domain-containing protein, partial [Vicinamibacterales bacterium]
MSSYVELHTASAFSFLQGASLPELLIDRAAELEYPAVALLDRDGVYGAPRFHKAAVAAGIKPIIGAELTIAVGPASAPKALRRGRAEARINDGASEGGAGETVQAIQPSPPNQVFVLPVLCES